MGLPVYAHASVFQYLVAPLLVIVTSLPYARLARLGSREPYATGRDYLCHARPCGGGRDFKRPHPSFKATLIPVPVLREPHISVLLRVRKQSGVECRN